MEIGPGPYNSFLVGAQLTIFIDALDFEKFSYILKLKSICRFFTDRCQRYTLEGLLIEESQEFNIEKQMVMLNIGIINI